MMIRSVISPSRGTACALLNRNFENGENAAMRQIVEREQYKISADPVKNRLYFQASGDLVDPLLFKHVADDWCMACSQMNPGFTILGDYSQVGVHFIKKEFTDGMKVVFDSGVKKVAVFWGKKVLGRWTTEQAAEAASTEYASKRRSFETRAEAEAWLDL